MKKVKATKKDSRRAPKAQSAASSDDNVVEQAITKVGGSPGELARQLSKLMGVEVSRQRVNGWRQRGIFPRDVIVFVAKVSGISLETLASAKQVDKSASNVVDRAIKSLGPGKTAGDLALALTKEPNVGRTITRQMVNGWYHRQQFPLELIVGVHLVTKIPVALLVERKEKEEGE